MQENAEEIDLEFLSEDLPKILDSMKDASDQITSISTSLRTFSRADTEHKVSANLHEGIDMFDEIAQNQSFVELKSHPQQITIRTSIHSTDSGTTLVGQCASQRNCRRISHQSFMLEEVEMNVLVRAIA